MTGNEAVFYSAIIAAAIGAGPTYIGLLNRKSIKDNHKTALHNQESLHEIKRVLGAAPIDDSGEAKP